MAFDKPQSRNEAILQNMLGANNELEPPKSRVEALLQDIAGQMPEANPSEGTTTGTLERIKIGDDIYSVEGGGSGTSDYDALNNKPQIADTTLSGNKSLADLGIASATTVSGILDGTDIDSFGDVETALGDKVDKVNGKGLSTNDYDDTEKAAVAAANTAIAGIKDGTTIDSFGDVETALGAIQDGQSIDSFADVETAIGAIEDGTTIDSFADVETELAGKQDVLTFDDAPTDGSNNPVKSNGVYDALATKADLTDLAPAFSAETAYTVGQYVSYDGNIYKCTSAHSAGAWVAGDFTLVAVGSELESKQNATDNNLETTSKTVVGAVNELKSGLINMIINQPTEVTFDTDGKGTFTAPTGYSPLVACLDQTWFTTIHFENGAFYVMAHATNDPTVLIKSTTVTYNWFLYFG
jgi:hypothetical protein